MNLNNKDDTLIFIPARSGSKGIKGKNVKKLNGKPLISYTIDFAIRNFRKEDIFISTNCDKVLDISKQYNLKIPKKRLENLSTDESPMYDTLLHTIHELEERNMYYKKLIMLQPTSPFRKDSDLKKIFNEYSEDLDAIISVVKSKSNPYFTLYEENNNGFLERSKKGDYYRRQDCPNVYELNGSIFLFNIASLKSGYINSFSKIKQFEMEQNYSIDIDDELDWEIAEIVSKKIDLK